MSFWGATVITSLATSIAVVGKQIVYVLWGGFSVDNPTLKLAGIVSAAAGVATRRFCFIRFCGTRWGFDQLYARSVVKPAFPLRA